MSRPVTRILNEISDGQPGAVDELFTRVYADLRAIAHVQLSKERPGHTLDTTALVHESYLRLVDLSQVRLDNRSHFFAVAARAMRRVLVDHARKHRAEKRGSGRAFVTLHEDIIATGISPDVLALDEALQRLSLLSPRQGNVVECRVFAGLSVKETSEALGVSEATIKRDWVAARAWLNRDLRTS